MAYQIETRPSLAGLDECSLRNGENNIEHSAAHPIPQDVAEAKRDLLREFVFEAAKGARDYSELIQKFVTGDDPAGLEYGARKFVAFAREVAKGCRQLFSGGEVFP
jgi:hypothetical protein